MEAALPALEYFGLPYQVQVLSAHRSPEQVAQFAASAEEQGYGVLIAGAGMAAHLAGALKAHSILPVIGVPLPGGLADGLDALLSTVQMPKGVPVSTVSVGKAGALNSEVPAAENLASGAAELRERLQAHNARGLVCAGPARSGRVRGPVQPRSERRTRRAVLPRELNRGRPTRRTGIGAQVEDPDRKTRQRANRH